MSLLGKIVGDTVENGLPKGRYVYTPLHTNPPPPLPYRGGGGGLTGSLVLSFLLPSKFENSRIISRT